MRYNSPKNRKYRLHQKLRKANISYSSSCKTIYFPVNQDLNNVDIQELVNDYHYQIQLEIPIS